MSDRVFVHIGAPKTGTTYLQETLHQNREALQEAGVLYPTISGDAHHTTLWDLRNLSEKRKFGQDIRGHWDTTVGAAREWPGHTTVISSELFVYLGNEMANRVLDAWGDAEVHVIYTARDLVRQVPAVWQERMKNGNTLAYGDFVADVLGKRKTGMAKGFWNAQDAEGALARWAQGIDPRHIHVVTAPLSGAAPDLLWHRFAGVLGVDGTRYPAKVSAANPSIGVTSAELLRRLNVRHGQHLSVMRYRRIVRRGLFDVLAGAVEDTTKLPLTAEQRQALHELSVQKVGAMERAGYDVVGSLDELVPAEPTRAEKKRAAAKTPDDVTDDEVVDALLDVVFDMLKSRHRGASTRKRT
ncbi:MAG: hypothetical protein H0U28_00375 [Nocardioidaceae bacterium]|nr:hypothetical protein [Nocardioidaceae bacterium]